MSKKQTPVELPKEELPLPESLRKLEKKRQKALAERARSRQKMQDHEERVLQRRKRRLEMNLRREVKRSIGTLHTNYSYGFDPQTTGASQFYKLTEADAQIIADKVKHEYEEQGVWSLSVKTEQSDDSARKYTCVRYTLSPRKFR